MFSEVYVILTLSLCALSVVLSIIVLHLYFKRDHHVVPERARHATLFLARLMCKQANKTSDNNGKDMEKTSSFGAEIAQRRQNNHRSVGSDAHVEQEVTWKDISIVMDSFLFRVYIILVVLFSVIFIGLVGAN